MIVRKTGHERSLIDSLSRALRPIPYWIGYKREKYWSHEVPEAAIIAELRETLMLAFCRDVNVRCEVPYSEINGSKIKATSKLDFGQKFNGLAMVRRAKYGACQFL